MNLKIKYGKKRNKISNLNYELNSIMNNINNTQSKINANDKTSPDYSFVFVLIKIQ